jgi:pyridinium-3,5-biscarboxylic acid mononucleotide synthase
MSHLDDLAAFARPDPERQRRSGIPEVVLAEHKSAEQTLAIARSLLERPGRVLLSRVPAATRALLEQAIGEGVSWQRYGDARTILIVREGCAPPPTGGVVGVLAAGTSDLPTAEEAAAMCALMGCEVLRAYDVGVAGLHRLFEPLQRMIERPVDAIIVAAGMDGALPSVVAGLVDVPVIGLPTAIGYGLGGQGVGALYTMLQTCSPGLAVVNIDNGIGAGSMAALIANRVAAARRQGPRTSE